MKTKYLKSIFRLTLILTIFSFNSFAQNAGDFDLSFGVNGMVNVFSKENFLGTNIAKIKTQNDGKIIYGNTFDYNNLKIIVVTRLNSDGTKDVTFGTNGNFIYQNFFLSDILILSEGSILLSGNICENTICKTAAFLKLNNDGVINTNFGLNGLSSLNYQNDDIFNNSAFISTDEKIVFCGNINNSITSDYSAFIARTNQNGEIDTNFANKGFYINNLSADYYKYKIIKSQNENKFIAGGILSSSSQNTKFDRFFSDGSLDTTFNIFINSFSADSTLEPNSLEFQADKIIVSSLNIDDNFSIFRFNNYGILDTTFGVNGKISNSEFKMNSRSSIKVDTKNRILVPFENYTNDGIKTNGIIRYTENGDIDETFGKNGYLKFISDFYNVIVDQQTDEKILITSENILNINGLNTFNSNIYRVYSDLTIKPYANQQICSVTCDSTTQKNMIIWEKPINEGIKSFKIYKESGAVGNFVNIAEIPFENEGKYIDETSNPKMFSNKYKISIIDTLNQESDLSDYHRTMQLTISLNLISGYNLIWTDYMTNSNNYAEAYTLYCAGDTNKFKILYENILPSGSGVIPK
ncbi:MAG: hypothetical protein UV46_C0015G0001 [Candidatus Gottesmanbacteria bacterium GW2011_GWC2_42_8]|nr:MAG: hypothetical protein UV46_C0015G0001 [Candidatus Gottesmanbacteria bacterium GW2011_GWC2_42_8]